MVSPEWFFSTLAQATAASIGFILAFVAVLYSARKSQTSNRKFRLMDHLQNIEREFDPVLGAVCDYLSEKGEFSDEELKQSIKIDDSQEKIEEMTEKYQNPISAKLYANLIRTQDILNLIVTPQPNEVKRKHLQYLNSTTSEVVDIFSTEENIEELFEELTVEDTDSDNPAKDRISVSRIWVIEEWLEQNFVREKSNTLIGWKHVLDELSHQTRRGGALAQGSDLLVSFDEYQHVLDQITVLFFIGVVLPMIFLLAEVPNWWPVLSGLSVTIVELSFLAAVSWYTYKLINSVSVLVESEANIG